VTRQQRRQARIELLAAADALARIAELTGEGRERYDLEPDRRGIETRRPAGVGCERA